MVAWNDYKSQAKERGALALELYVVHTTPTDPDAVTIIIVVLDKLSNHIDTLHRSSEGVNAGWLMIASNDQGSASCCLKVSGWTSMRALRI